MIYSFSFKNFFSFAEKAEITFNDIREGIEEQNTMFFTTDAGERLSKIMMLLGPNASGKTNALKALAFLSWFVGNSFVELKGETEEIPLDPFAFREEGMGISEFELLFEHKRAVFKYVLHLQKTQVLREELHRREESGRFNYLFKRSWNPESKSSNVEQRIDLSPDILEKILRRNVSLISAAVAIKSEFLTDIASFWGTITTNVNRTGKSWDVSSLADRRLSDASEFYNNNQGLFAKAEKFLKDTDLGLDGISIQASQIMDPKTAEPKRFLITQGIHKVNGKSYPLPFLFESSGTKNMFVLLRYLFPVIEQGGVAVIDELELDLHPHMIPHIIGLFANPATNPKNSQLLFTSHSLEVLNYLQKEQVTLVQKKSSSESEVYRLDELDGVRRDDNLYAKYMAGAYGAVPNI